MGQHPIRHIPRWARQAPISANRFSAPGGPRPVFSKPIADALQLHGEDKVRAVELAGNNVEVLAQLARLEGKTHRDVSRAAIRQLGALVSFINDLRTLELVAGHAPNKPARDAAIERIAASNDIAQRRAVLQRISCGSDYPDTRMLAQEKLQQT